MHHVIQPEGSAVCGQACVAMATGVSLKRAIEVFGHKKTSGTWTRELVTALRFLGLTCADKLHVVSRHRPYLPSHCIIHIKPKEKRRKHPHGHWMLNWEGKIYDPGNRWPEGYIDWAIVSYLEIYK